MMKKYFSSIFFLRSGIELHFRFSILRAPVEVYRCLQANTFNRRTDSKRLNIDDFSRIFNDFRWFFGLHPNSLPPKIRPKSIFKKLVLEDFFFLNQKFMYESYQEKYTAPLGTPGGMFSDLNQKSVTDFHGALCAPTREA